MSGERERIKFGGNFSFREIFDQRGIWFFLIKNQQNYLQNYYNITNQKYNKP